MPRRDEDEDEDPGDRRSPPPPPPLTGILWNSEKYHGSPLSLSDERLGSLASWVQNHNITVVKLDCLVKDGGEDVYPSFIGRVEHSHWSRSVKLLCSDWLNFGAMSMP